jgi:hypothetical protein
VLILIHAVAAALTRSTTPTCCAPAPRGAARPPGDGTLNAGHLPARLHLRPRAPTRPGAGRGDQARLGRRGGARHEAPGDRHRQLPRRGQRPPQAGCLPWLHRQARLPPLARHPGGDGRGPARPPAQGSGQLRARGASLLRRAPRPRAQGRGNRGGPDPRRLGLLLGQGDRLPGGKGARYSISVTQHKRMSERISRIPESARQPVSDYPETGICELAETTWRPPVDRPSRPPARPGGTELFAYWRHFAFLTNRTEDMHTVDAEHRQHAEVELAIRDPRARRLPTAPPGRSTPTRPGP